MAPHSSILAWGILWREEPGRLQSMGSQSRTRLSDFTFTFTMTLQDSGEENGSQQACMVGVARLVLTTVAAIY